MSLADDKKNGNNPAYVRTSTHGSTWGESSFQLSVPPHPIVSLSIIRRRGNPLLALEELESKIARPFPSSTLHGGMCCVCVCVFVLFSLSLRVCLSLLSHVMALLFYRGELYARYLGSTRSFGYQR